MQFQVLGHRMHPNAVDPVMLLKCRAEYIFSNEIILSISGHLFTDRGVLVSTMSWKPKKDHRQWITVDEMGPNRNSFEFEMFGQVSRRAAAHLESFREADPRKDVRLSLEMTCEVISLKIIKQDLAKGTLLPDHICSAENCLSARDQVAEKSVFQNRQEIVIPSSDWMHDYKPLLGLGSFIGVELPVPCCNTEEIDEITVKTHSLLNTINENYLECNWASVVIQARKLFEFLTAEEVFEKLRGFERYNEETFNDFRKVLESGCQFAAKFHHSTSRKHQPADNPETAARADAEFFMGVASGIGALVVRMINCMKETKKTN